MPFDVFRLRDTVVGEYQSYFESFINILDERITAFVGGKLTDGELWPDAVPFQLHDIARDDVDYIMETFPIVKRRGIWALGNYRTKRVILEIYDAMLDAMCTGRSTGGARRIW